MNPAVSVKEKYQVSEKLVNEEFKIWKKTSPMLYDLIYSYSLQWPSLTVEWLKSLEKKDVSVTASFLAGTHTSDGSKNYLRQYSVRLPTAEAKDKNAFLENQIKLEREWEHPGEINKLRINQESGLVATQTNFGDVLIYDLNGNSVKTLKFHTKEGFGLEWNPIYSKNQLLSSSEDHKVALWNMGSESPARVFETHSAIVNDVAWNKQYNEVIASVSDDLSLQIHDLRSPKPVISIANAHSGPVNSVAFQQDIGTLLATGSSDNLVNCWDLRLMDQPIRKLYGHTGSVVDLKFRDNLLLSSSSDRRVLVWNLSNIRDGEFDLKEYEKKKGDYIDPCLVFMHGGHTGRICEADWHPELDNVVVSCAEDGLVEIWRPRHIDEREYDEEE
ncbi:hypothetical protein OGAPHI_007216 [Ogataea philodendri]|uniref:Histone-binding protein RBBP4-like N-terminal domain-containing protein n=1 Tax=Ogataea philodendri TaxID=1378263 RepID=A0A9P8NVJ0_9ASCO|nr:uncharacterized protein OGAPHI_007216 [Ogataea philodendri]KAH3660011.1 hypothetical protein OGAPHI_007216 [Ogataea philodendri]